MTRPTKEKVEEALFYAQTGEYYGIAAPALATLSAEVVALREELASLERSMVREAFALDPAYFREHVPGYDAIMATATYSTEAVDALLEAWDDWDCDGDLVHVRNRVDAVRASREPPLKASEETST